MGGYTIPSPNIADEAGQIAAAPATRFQEYQRSAQLEAQNRLLQQQTQEATAAAQIKTQQARDMQALTKLAPSYVQKDDQGNITGYDFDGLMNHAASAGVSPQTLQTMQAQRAQARQQMAGASKDERENEEALNKHFGDSLESMRGISDPAARESAWQNVVAENQRLGGKVKLPPQAPSDDQIPVLEAGLGMHSQLLSEGKTAAEASASQAKARKDAADAAHQEIINNLAKNSKPGDFDAQVDQMLPPNDVNTGGQNRFVKAQVNAALQRGDYDGAKKFIDQAYESQLALNKDIAVQTNPKIQAGKVQVAGAEASARQQAAQGSPEDAGKLLASGDLTLTDLKSRGTTPKFITQSVAAAQKINPKYNPADEVIAEQVAKSPAANQFFGSANSLIAKGGTLDQLEQIGKRIPQHDMPVLNTIDDWQKLARGKGPLAGYAALALGVADDYGKVMGGGNASDHARDAALALFSKAASPEMRQEAIDATRQAVQSQRDHRIGTNQFLKRQYGVEVGGSAQPSSKTLSMAAVQKAAKDHGVSVDEAKRQAVAAGYTVQ